MTLLVFSIVRFILNGFTYIFLCLTITSSSEPFWKILFYYLCYRLRPALNFFRPPPLHRSGWWRPWWRSADVELFCCQQLPCIIRVDQTTRAIALTKGSPRNTLLSLWSVCTLESDSIRQRLTTLVQITSPMTSNEAAACRFIGHMHVAVRRLDVANGSALLSLL